MTESAVTGAAAFFLLVYVACAFLLGFICASVAEAKGLSVFSWFIAGLLFNLVALIAVAGMPDLKSQTYLRRLAEALPQDEYFGA